MTNEDRAVAAAQAPAPTLAQRLAATNKQLAENRKELNQLDNEVATKRASLANMQRVLSREKKTEGDFRVELQALARFTYERKPMLLLQVMQANSVDQLLTDLSQDQAIEHNQSQLLHQAIAAVDETERTEASMRHEIGSLTLTAQRAETVRKQALATRMKIEKELAAIKLEQQQAAAAQAAKLAAEEAQLMAAATQQANLAAQAQSVAVGAGTGSTENHFDFGYCTWYVATKRYVPWFGNAIDWWANAAADGYAEGQTPAVGAIMVEDFPPYGHVAYVESVNSDGSWTVSEMNYQGWDVVDYRTIRPGQDPVVGFIYGPAGSGA